jgi:drug/metabolite transporter (DMT)-like permease
MRPRSREEARSLHNTMTSSTTPPAAASHGLRALAERRPVGLVVIGVVLFSTGPVMVGAASVSGPIFSFWRLWIGVVVLAGATLVHGRVIRSWPSSTGWRWAIQAGAMFGLHQLSFMTALRLTSVVDVTLMNTLAPVVVAVLAVPLFGERPGPAFRIWSGVAIAGAALVALASAAGPEGDPVGMILAALNVVAYAIYFVWSKQAREHIDTVPFLFGSTVAAALTVSVFVVLAGEPVGSIDAHDLLLCLAVALLPGALGHFSVTWSLRWVPANLPPVLMLAIPVLSGAMAWVLLDETVTAVQVLGGILTIAGVAGALRSTTNTTVVESLTTAEEA